MAVWEAYHDPKDGKVKPEGENVIEFNIPITVQGLKISG